LVLLAATLSILLPIALVVIMVLPQAVNGMKVLDQLRESGWLQGPEAQHLFDSIDEYLRMLPGMEDGLRQMTRQAADLAGTFMRAGVARGVDIATNFLNMAFNIFLMVALAMVSMLYAPTLHEYTCAITGCPAAVLERFVVSIRAALRAVLAGVVLVAILQGILCGIAFAFTGVPQAAFWGLLAAFIAPIPVIGTATVWIPACLYLWYTGSTASAVGLALWCIIVVAGVDNFMRPYFLQGGIDAPFVVVLVTVLCGLIAFGPAGLVAGPVLMAFALQAAREAKTG
jgi:predicted PurR-regulated permease PerM